MEPSQPQLSAYPPYPAYPPQPYATWVDPRQLPHRVTMALVCMHVIAALYAAIAVAVLVGFTVFASDSEDAIVGMVLGGICLALAAGVEVVAIGLHRRKFWAWIVGLIIFGMFAMSIFFVLGGLGLWGLLDTGSRAQFGVGVSGPPAEGFQVMPPRPVQSLE